MTKKPFHPDDIARLEQVPPVLRSADVQRRPHGAAVAEAVHAAIENVEPEAFCTRAIHRFRDDQTLPGHPDRLVENDFRRLAVVEGQEQQGTTAGLVIPARCARALIRERSGEP